MAGLKRNIVDNNNLFKLFALKPCVYGAIGVFLIGCFSCSPKINENGSEVWLRNSKEVIVKPNGQLLNGTVIANRELEKYWKGNKVELKLSNREDLHKDGYLIEYKNKKAVVEARSQEGLLYGVFELIRLQNTDKLKDGLSYLQNPSFDLRILNHWDNLDGRVERGYSGRSIWKWNQLPDTICNRYENYAIANASIGINGVVLNNVNATPDILSTPYLEKVKRISDILAPYGIKTFLSINFSTPTQLGGLPTSDPLNEDVVNWWKGKVSEIYNMMPEFGGFLVKANSEGLPGPQDYGRTHADGANMLADVLLPYRGIVMWREIGRAHV